MRWWRRLISRLPYKWRKAADYTAIASIILICALVLRNYGSSETFSGVRVIDGDSLRSGTAEIRLQGIDAPEYRQTCLDRNQKSYACGKMAARHLRRLVRGNEVQCRVINHDRYNRDIAICQAGGRELNKAMVEDGWAVAYLRHSLAYGAAEARARADKRGIWQGIFDNPEQWREANRGSLAGGDASGSPSRPVPD